MSHQPILINFILSDTHCGSDVGLMPPTVQLNSGNLVSHGSNHHQAWLWQNWKSLLKDAYKIIGKDKFVLTINGDAIEGIHHRSTEMVSQKWEEHLQIATDVLKPIADKASKVLVVKGTECHTQNLEQALSDRLGGGVAKDKHLYKINGCLIDAAHHTACSSRSYLEAGAYSTHMINAIANYAKAEQEIPKVYLRGHRHVGGHFSNGYGLYAVTGAWQFLTRHGHKVVTDSIPSPTLLILDWRGIKKGDLPRVHELRATPPQEEIQEL